MLNVRLRLGQKLASVIDDIFAFISSPTCPVCGGLSDAWAERICQSCQLELKRQFCGMGPVCLLCRGPLEIQCPCRSCEIGSLPALYHWGYYTATMAELIGQFKFAGDRGLGQQLARLASEALHDRLSANRFDIVASVPLTAGEQRKRGFNQADIIAEAIASYLQIDFDSHVLAKVKATKPQSTLKAAERWDNVKEAFAVRPRAPIKGASVLLVDDIVTTGATTLDCARALLAGGAANVTVVSLVSAGEVPS